jgi:hypothetical protein
MNNKVVPPSISSVSFSCPHCGAHADQTWYDVFAVPIEKHGTPFRPDQKFLEVFKDDKGIPEEPRRPLRTPPPVATLGRVKLPHVTAAGR